MYTVYDLRRPATEILPKSEKRRVQRTVQRETLAREKLERFRGGAAEAPAAAAAAAGVAAATAAVEAAAAAAAAAAPVTCLTTGRR